MPKEYNNVTKYFGSGREIECECGVLLYVDDDEPVLCDCGFRYMNVIKTMQYEKPDDRQLNLF